MAIPVDHRHGVTRVGGSGRDYGFNGGFADHGEGPLEWLQKWQLRFYNDHTAAKRLLVSPRRQQQRVFQKYQRDPRAIRRGTDGPPAHRRPPCSSG